MAKLRYSALLIFIFILISSSSIQILSQTEITEDTVPIAFFLTEEEEDFPSVHPLGIKEDSRGNIHSWMYYIEPERPDRTDQFFIVYYSVISPDGNSSFIEVDRQPFSLTRLSIFYKQDFYEFDDGTVTAVFLKTSDFGTFIKRIRYDQDTGYKIESIESPKEFDFTGHIIGPLITDNKVEYLFPAKNTTSNRQVLSRFRFADSISDPEVEAYDFPNVLLGNVSKQVNEVFDVAYANDSRYWLSTIDAAGSNQSLVLVNDFMNGTYAIDGFVEGLNVAPIANFELFRHIRADILLPQLVSTTSGKLFTFLSSFEGEFNYLTQWKNGTATRILDDLDIDPFFLQFLVHLGTYGDVLKASSLSIQYAQLSISFTVDIIRYNTTTGELEKSRFQDSSFNKTFFLFASDDNSDKDIGLVSSIGTTDQLKEDYNILNGTISSVYVFTDAELPVVTPGFVNILFREPESDDTERNTTMILIGLAILFGLSVFGFTYLHKRNQQFTFPVEFNIKREDHKFSRLEKTNSKINNYFRSKAIYFSANRSRIISSVMVMTLPAIILLSLFTGILSHQEALLVTYEHQNSLNDQEDFIFQNGDFTWGDSWYKDEFTSLTLSEVDFAIPEELSKQAFIKYGLDDIAAEMSSFTYFPLFERRHFSFIEDGTNQSISYPWAQQFTVLGEGWKGYIEEQLIEGRLPEAPHEVLVQESWYSIRDAASPQLPYGVIYGVNSTIEFEASELDIFLNITTPGMKQNVTIVGVVKKVENQSFNEIKFWADKLNTTLPGLRFLDSLPFYTFPSLISEFLPNFSRLSIRPLNYVNIRYNVFDLDREKIPGIIDGFTTLGTQTISQTGFSWLGRLDEQRIVTFLEEYFEASRDIQLEGVVLTIPALLLILILTFDGLNIGKTSVQQEILRFRKEGMRTENIFSLFVHERFVTTTIATVFGIIFVNSTTGFLLSLTGFFNIESENTPPVTTRFKLILYLSVFFVLFIVGLIRSIQYFIVESDWRYSQDLKGFKGDLIIISIGVILAFSSNYLSGYFQDQANLIDTGGNVDAGTQLVILNLRLIALLVAAFGGIIVLSKIMNRLFMLIGKFGWKISRSSKGLVFNGIRTNTSLYGRALLILILTFVIIVPMIVVPSTLNFKYENAAYDELGTDIRVENWHLVANETKDKILNLQDVEQSSVYFYEPVTFIADIEIRIFAIDPDSYLQSIVVPQLFEKDYEENLKLISTLGKGEILTNEEFIERNTLTIGQTIPIEFTNHIDDYHLEVVDSYHQLPVLKYELLALEAADITPLQMVMTLETLLEIQALFSSDSTRDSSAVADALNNRNLMIKASSIYNVDDIVSVVRQGGTQVQFITQLIQEKRHPFFRAFEFITHLSIIVAAIAPLLASMILARILFERRKDELEVYLRAGATRNAYIKQLSLEYILTVIFPSIIGIPLGYWWSYSNGPEFFGETAEDLFWKLRLDFIVVWMLITWILSLTIWVWQLKSSIDKHLKEVRL
ncbi:MAG: hypothetical protein GPJ54_04790 [Candidatus Heimdallarchaeota archaeon]|nr:hypothetical protein [Candidatus Heimdallarchaeota archaeon]